MQLIDSLNLNAYEWHYSEGIAQHSMPDVNTVRCEVWFFRKNRRPGKILDYGFGYGQELIYFADHGYDVYGLEIALSAKSRFDDYIKENRPELADRVKTQLLQGEASALPYQDDWFDFIHSNSVIHHLPSEAAIQGLLWEWHRVLKPGGLLVFSTVGPEYSLIKDGVKVGENLYECEFQGPAMAERIKRRSYLMQNEAHIRSLCHMFDVHEVGWFTHHYCGIDGFHWLVLAEKSSGVSETS